MCGNRAFVEDNVNYVTSLNDVPSNENVPSNEIVSFYSDKNNRPRMGGRFVSSQV